MAEKKVINKNAENFVKFLAENQITNEEQPVMYTDTHHAVIVLHDKIESTGFAYRWELVFDPNNCLANINGLRFVEGIRPECVGNILELVNEKNKTTLWGKFFFNDGAVSVTTAIYDRDAVLVPSDMLDILKLVRGSIEELHREVLKALL